MQFLGRAPQIERGLVFDDDGVALVAQRFGLALAAWPASAPSPRFRRRQAVLRLQPRQCQQVLDQLRHALRLALHLGQHRRPFGLVGRIEHVEVAMHDRQWRAQLVRDVGDEVAAHLFQPHQLADVARDQQPKLVGIGDQAQAQAQVAVRRRGRVHQRFGVAAGGEPARDRQRLQALRRARRRCRADSAGRAAAWRPR